MPSRQTGAAKTTADHQSGAGVPPRRDSAAVRIGSSLLGLQQALGNRAVLHMLGAQRVQTKLRIGPPGDLFEQEADRVAQSVVSTSRTGMTEATGSLHPAPAGGIQRKCAQCEQEEEETIRRSPQEGTDATTETAPAPEAASPAAETTPETPAPESTPAPGEQAPAEPVAEAKAGATLLVEDDAEQVGPGQMHKSEFLAALREAVCATANEAMASTGQTTADCPWMGYWFDQAAQKDAAYVEKALRKYAPETADASTAQEIIPLVAARVRRSVEVWATTGEITGVPEGVSTDVPGAQAPETGGQATGADGILFKARPGGPRRVSDPQAIRNQLGPGRSLPGGVRSRMESAFGLSFSQVRIHNDASAGALSDQLNARAFTVGEHVAFGPGEYQPGSLAGDALLAHELAHVGQQGGATASGPMMKGEGEYDALEQDADRSAVGAVASLWAQGRGGLKNLGRSLLPGLKSGLRLSRCSKNKAATSSKKSLSVDVTYLSGGSTDLATHLAKANDVYKQADVEIKAGKSATLDETKSKAVLGADLILDEYSDPNSPTAEEQALLKENRGTGITMYYVKGMSHGSLGEAFWPATGNPIGFVYASTNSRTWPHELGHVLLDSGDHPADADNFMAQTSAASGKELMTREQIETIRKNIP